MEVSPGYKLTEAGVIPEAWDVATIGAVAKTSSGTTPPRQLADRYYRNGHIPWVKTLDLNNSEIFFTEEQVMARASHWRSMMAITTFGCGTSTAVRLPR
jgi:type I restriction enzyme S subunit